CVFLSVSVVTSTFSFFCTTVVSVAWTGVTAVSVTVFSVLWDSPGLHAAATSMSPQTGRRSVFIASTKARPVPERAWPALCHVPRRAPVDTRIGDRAPGRITHLAFLAPGRRPIRRSSGDGRRGQSHATDLRELSALVERYRRVGRRGDAGRIAATVSERRVESVATRRQRRGRRSLRLRTKCVCRPARVSLDPRPRGTGRRPAAGHPAWAQAARGRSAHESCDACVSIRREDRAGEELLERCACRPSGHVCVFDGI